MLQNALLPFLSRLVLIVVLVLGGLGSVDGAGFSVSEAEKVEVKSGEGQRQVRAWETLIDFPTIRVNSTYLAALSKQLSNVSSGVVFNLNRVLPNVPTSKLDDFFRAIDNPKSVDHLRSLVGDFDNIPGLARTRYTPNGLPMIDKAPPATWADPLLHLPGREAGNFTSATAKTLSPGQKIYRVLGDGQNPAGGYWTYQLPSSRADLFGGFAVRPEWNAANRYVEYTVPPGGLKVWDGPAARQQLLDHIDDVHLPGGGVQIYIPEPYRQVGNAFDNLTLNNLSLP